MIVLEQAIRLEGDFDTSSEVETLRTATVAKADGAKSADLLEKAATLLLDVADKSARGATVSETRSDMIEVTRHLHHAYVAAKEAGEYPQAALVDALETQMRDIDAYYNPNSGEER